MTLQKVSIHYRTIMTYEQSALPTVILNSEFHSEMFWMKQELFIEKNILGIILHDSKFEKKSPFRFHQK